MKFLASTSMRRIAADTWKFAEADVDPATNLPMDNRTLGARARRRNGPAPR